MTERNVGGNTSQELSARVKRIEEFLKAGREDSFVTAWGRLFAGYAQQRMLLLVCAGLNVVMACSLVYLSLVVSKKAPWVFVKDAIGNVVQVDPRSFLEDGDRRDEAELKGFGMRFVRDAFEFTPLDIRDRTEYALRFVEPQAHGTARLAMRFSERAEQADRGSSVKILEDLEKGQVMKASVLRWDPMEVLVVFSRVAVSANATGEIKALTPLAVRLRLRQVPRSPQNPHGLLVTDVTSDQG